MAIIHRPSLLRASLADLKLHARTSKHLQCMRYNALQTFADLPLTKSAQLLLSRKHDSNHNKLRHFTELSQ